MTAESAAVACRRCCIDCSFPLSESSTSWPTCRLVERQVILTPETTKEGGARNKQAFTLNGGSGTHIDAPSHFIPHGRTIDALSANELVEIPLAIVDVSSFVKQNNDFSCTLQHILDDEQLSGAIAPGSLVCLRTGWAEERYGKQEYYNYDESAPADAASAVRHMHFPAFGPDAAKFLVRERSIVGIGIDTLSPDSPGVAGFPVHHIVLGSDRFILENLLLPTTIPARGASAIVSPISIVGAPEAPARVWAMLPATA
uniref:Cyclase n=1 Tax=Chrysotila carterae TaxID=13221 RepID=A0A7S4C2Z5_CHRCT